MGSGNVFELGEAQTVARPSLADTNGSVDITRSVTRQNAARACRILTRLIHSPLKVAHGSVSQILLVPTIFNSYMMAHIAICIDSEPISIQCC